jgi:Seven in absentia protein family
LQLLTLKNSEENPSGIECLGNLLKIWQCNWSGSKKEFHEHFVRSHNHIEIFSQFQVSSVPFQSDQLLSAMTLVRAFDSTFVFLYHTNPSSKMIYFLICLLDDEDQPKPESFLYELMIKSPKANHCKVNN